MQKKSKNQDRQSYEFVVDNTPYHIEVSPFIFNEEKRFMIKINDEDTHVFVWDPDAFQLRPLDDESAILPDNLEKAISDKLVKI
ncbi:MAG: hypothetical protein JWM28_3728 [Chitinophagaceae bacterium]|nr:hypothetical protein [Chitinophagaceae bacterium]